MKTITSITNSKIKLLASLKTAKGRRENGLFLAEGARLVNEALKSGVQIVIAAIEQDQKDVYNNEIQKLEISGAKIILCKKHIFEKISDAVTPQGIAVALKIPEAEISGEKIVALDRVSDPGNVGTILRTAQAFGCTTALVSKGSADPYSPKCVRAGMGAHFKINICMEADLVKRLENLADQGYSIIGADINGNESLANLDSIHKRVCVIGSEAFGLSDKVKNACSFLWRIAMPGEAESLNASVAAGILLYRVFIS